MNPAKNIPNQRPGTQASHHWLLCALQTPGLLPSPPQLSLCMRPRGPSRATAPPAAWVRNSSPHPLRLPRKVQSALLSVCPSLKSKDNLLFHEQHLSLSLGGKNASEKEQLASYNNTDGKERVTHSYPKTRAVTGA